MTVVVGLPLRSAAHGKPLIAAFVLHADGGMTRATARDGMGALSAEAEPAP